jgi:hypothetical protein
MKFSEYASILDVSGSGSSHLAFISAYRGDRPKRLNRLWQEQLKKDVTDAGFRWLPAKGQSVENTAGGRVVVKERSLLVVGFAVTRDAFKEHIVHWLNKYGQEYALVRFSQSDEAWVVYATGNQFRYGGWEKDVAGKYK